jgi:HK97 family phage portal protein
VAKKRTTSAKVAKRDSVVITPSSITTQVIASTIAISPASYPLSVVEASGIAAVRRCVSLIANAIAGQRWTEWEGGVQITPPSRLVKRPAAMFSRREWAWRVVSQMALQDIAYLRMVGGVDDEGVPGSLIPLPTEAISPAGYSDPFGIFPPTSYSISGVAGTISGEEVIPMRSAFWPGVPLYLQGILKQARNTMMQAWASDSYGARYWQAGGSPVTIVTTEQELTDPQADTIAERWRSRRAKGPDYPAVLGKGAHADAWGADIGNAVAVEARREMVVEIANLFGVPARYVNVVPTGNSMTYANLNDEALSLERFTLSGFVDPVQDVISDLLPDERFMLIDMSRLTRPSQESRFRAWAIATGNKPWMMPGEIRGEEGLPPNADIDAIEDARIKAIEAGAEGMNNQPQMQPEPEAEEIPA